MSELVDSSVDVAALMGRIERLEADSAQLRARAQIRELMADYAHGCDEQDAERFMRIWHDDALYDVGGDFGSGTGLAEIREKLEIIWRESPETRHWITDITVDFDETDANRATGNAHTICYVRNADGQHFCSAWYENVYTQRDGVWKVQEVHLTVHWLKALPFGDPA